MSVKVMWGDPPKPNIWKVLKKMSHSYYVVEIGTPIPNLTVKIETLEPTLGSEATLEVYIDNGRHEYLIWQSDDLRSFQDFDMFYHYILSHAFWKEIARSFKNDSEVKKHNLRLASSEPKVMWGDPPKPNLWKLEKRIPILYAIKSPLFKDGQEILIYDSDEGTHVKFSESREHIAVYSTDIRSAIPLIADKTFWAYHKDRITPHLKVDKVASSEPKVMWGDPPKPNLWKIQEDINGTHLKSGFVKSPLLNPTVIRYSFVGYGQATEFIVDIDYKGRRKVLEVFEKVSFVEGIKELTSQGFWERNRDEIKAYLKPYKVASSEHKVMWGDPPKPNLWEMRHKVFNGVKSNVMVRSPLIKGGRILIFLEESYGHTRIRVVNGESFKDVFSMTRSNSDIEDTLDFIKSPEFWHHAKDYIKPLMVVNKVAKAKNESTRNNRH